MARKLYRFCLIVEPFVYLIIMISMFKISGQEDFMSFVVLGTGIITLWSTIAFSTTSDLERERRVGTLKGLFASPTDFRVVVFSKAIGNTVLGLIPMVILVIFALISGQGKVAEPGWFVISLLECIIAFLMISLVFSSIFTLSRETRIFMNCLEYPIYILCGVVFPVSVLPEWMQKLSYVLAPTWAVQLLRDSVNGITNRESFITKFLILFGISLLYFLLACFLFKVVERRVRVTASLEVG